MACHGARRTPHADSPVEPATAAAAVCVSAWSIRAGIVAEVLQQCAGHYGGGAALHAPQLRQLLSDAGRLTSASPLPRPARRPTPLKPSLSAGAWTWRPTWPRYAVVTVRATAARRRTDRSARARRRGDGRSLESYAFILLSRQARHLRTSELRAQARAWARMGIGWPWSPQGAAACKGRKGTTRPVRPSPRPGSGPASRTPSTAKAPARRQRHRGAAPLP